VHQLLASAAAELACGSIWCHLVAETACSRSLKTIAIDLTATPNSSRGRADPAQIGQVLMNLAVNARRDAGRRHA
jgi:signal transduction histidine kinase